jgi:plasmid stabilization system protein ParE
MADRYRILLPKKVSVDLQHIHEHISLDSELNAASVIAEIIEAMESLQDFPHRFPVHSGRREAAKTVRRMPVGQYLVYFQINELNKAVSMIHVRHRARRQPRRFP